METTMTTEAKDKGGLSYNVSLRQEIMNTAGIRIKEFVAMQYSVGKADLQMYWFRGADGSSMQVNRNNILSIVSTNQYKDGSAQTAI